jgi:junctophilin
MAGAPASGTTVQTVGINGGRFDFDDGGTYCGGWEEGKAHGHGVCTGPKGQGEYTGSWHYGFEVSGVYTWPSGSFYEGNWQNGKRHGLGVESRGKWLYRGEWTQGFKGRYGVRQSTTTLAKYEGTWANGLQDGYGSETYADGGTYQGQWLRGMRHGYGVRTSAAFGIASHSRGGDGRRPSISSLQPGLEETKVVMTNGTRGGSGEEARGGFVLKSRSDEAPVRRRSLVERTGMKNLMQGLRIRKQRSTGDLDRKGVIGSIRSTGSTTSWMSSESNYAGASIMSEGSQASFVVEDEMLDSNVTETYMGEWKNDKRCGFGISERSDGLKYEGEWFNNRKYGYGVTTFKDGSREEGKYKNNILITSNKKKHLFLIRSAKFRERIDSAVNAAQRASKIALQKADIAISRTATARGKAEQADYAAVCARDDSTEARACALKLAPDFGRPGLPSLEVEKEHPPIQSHSHLAPLTLDKLDLPGAGKAGPGPPSPRGVGPPSPRVIDSGQPSPRSQGLAQPPFSEKTVSNHIGNQGNVINKPSVPNPSVDVRNNYTAPPVNPTPAAPAKISLNQSSQPVQNSMTLRAPPTRPQPQRFSPPLPSEPTRQNMTNKSDISPRVSTVSAPALAAPTMRLEPEMPSFPDPSVLRQPNTLQISEQISRGRTPTRQERSRMGAAQNDIGASQAGGYNFQKIMDDRFEHYKRPPSRERSADRYGLGSRQGSRQQLSRDVSRDRNNRPQSRQRTPMSTEQGFSENKTNSGLDHLNLDAIVSQPTGNGSAGGGLSDLKLPVEDQLRFRGVQQEIPHFGAPPKRTESLYMKPDTQQATYKVLGTSSIQRKKSLPDVAALPAVTVKAGSAVMTREEISVLSSARREQIRRDLEEAEKYRANPILYIFNPHIRDWFSRQQLMFVVVVVNITLAVMFFKLLT